MLKTLIVEDLKDTGHWLAGLVNSAFSTTDITFAQTLSRATELIRQQRFGLILIDLNLPDGSGIDLVNRINHLSPDSYAVIVTIYDDPEHLFPAIRAGAHGYLLKDQPESDLIQRLIGVMHGEPPISPGIARKMLDFFHHDSTPALLPELEISLTPREEDVLVMVANGFSRQEIANTLGLSVNTVARYIKDLYRKLDVSSRAEAAIFACRIGLIKVN